MYRTTVFKLECDRTKSHKIYLHPASQETRPLDTLSPSDINNMDVTIDLKTHKQGYVYVTRDQNKKYYLFVEGESGLVKEEITLHDPRTLDIRELQSALEKPRSAKKSLTFADNEIPDEQSTKKSKQDNCFDNCLIV